MSLNESVFQSFSILKTKRLVLRDIRAEDANAIFEMRTNGRGNQFIARPPLQSLAQVSELIDKVISSYTNKEGIGWAAMLRNGNQMIGSCGFNRIEHENLRAEIGGEMSTKFWGKGIALEAVEAIINFGFHIMALSVWPVNKGAIYLLDTLGFEKEAHFKDALFYKGNYMDIAVYSLVSK